MASVNKVIILGNLGKDPEVRYTPSGSAVASLRIATTRNWKNRDSGERQEETEWHSVVFYERLAEVAGEYLKKGRPVYVEGRLRTRKWQDKDGKDRYTTEIIGESMQLLGSRDDDDTGAQAEKRQRDRDNYDERPSKQAPATKPAASKPAAAPRPSTGFDDMMDDIPF